MTDDTAYVDVFKAAAAECWELHSNDVMAVRCEDKSVGVVETTAGFYDLSRKSQFTYREIDDHGSTRRLVLVLESPHKAEYPFGRKKGDIRPAKGPTGGNIRKYLGRLLEDNSLSLSEPVELLLVNAVQYQCSQRRSLVNDGDRAKRDCVFREAFGFGTESQGVEFAARLSRYLLRADDIVLNCCGKGVTNPPMCDLVLDALQKLPDRQFVLHCTSHPYSWIADVNRLFRKNLLIAP